MQHKTLSPLSPHFSLLTHSVTDSSPRMHSGEHYDIDEDAVTGRQCNVIAYECRFTYRKAKAGKKEKSTAASSYSGRLATYPPDGFIRELPEKTFQTVHHHIDELRNNHWIDDGTRAIFVELTVYNPQLIIFCAIKYVAHAQSSRNTQ